MHLSQVTGKVASDISLQTFRKFFIFENCFKSGWTLLMYSIDGEGIYFDIISFEAANIVSQYLLKNFILIGWSFPFGIRNTEFFCIIFSSFWYDLITAIGTALSVPGMITAIG